MAYLQPHEDVIGTDCSDNDLLSIEPPALAHRMVIREVARHLHSACLVGNPAPKVQRMYERITRPQVGDLVVEQSTFYRADEKSLVQGFGVLIAERDEWWQTDEDYAADIAENRREMGDEYEPDSRSVDHAWYVQYGQRPADICRWTNCSFIVVPVADSFDRPFGTRAGNAVTLTKDDLLGSLADSGFAAPDRTIDRGGGDG